MQHVLLKDVTSESHQWTIRARVVRLSEYVNTDNPPRIIRIDLILLDEEGKAMEGQILENWIQRFRPQLKEDHVYYIKYFQVLNARSVYRPVDHPYMMRFTAHTKVYEVNPAPPNFPLYAHATVPFDVLHTRIGINEYCSDAIGVFTGCTNVKIQNTRAGPKPLRNVYITDGRETATVALWGHHAESFDAEHYIQLGQAQPLVFLFCAMNCGRFEGKLSLQGSTLCKWYANPSLPEVSALQDSCIGRIPPPTWIGPSISHSEPQRISVADLASFDNPHVIYSNRYIVTAKIKNVVPNQSWWYLACDSCNKTIHSHGATFKCTGGSCTSTSGSPRYRLSVFATDPNVSATTTNPPTVELVFFGPTAEEIIGAPVDGLIASESGVGAFLPTRITSLYGKVYELRVSVSPGSLQRINITYQVENVIGVGNIAVPPPQSAPAHTQQASIHLPGTVQPSDQNTSIILPSSVQSTPGTSESFVQPPGSIETPPQPKTPGTQDPTTPTVASITVTPAKDLNIVTATQPIDTLPSATLSTMTDAEPSKEPISDQAAKKRPISELEDEECGEQTIRKERSVNRKLTYTTSSSGD